MCCLFDPSTINTYIYEHTHTRTHTYTNTPAHILPTYIITKNVQSLTHTCTHKHTNTQTHNNTPRQRHLHIHIHTFYNANSLPMPLSGLFVCSYVLVSKKRQLCTRCAASTSRTHNAHTQQKKTTHSTVLTHTHTYIHTYIHTYTHIIPAFPLWFSVSWCAS